MCCYPDPPKTFWDKLDSKENWRFLAILLSAALWIMLILSATSCVNNQYKYNSVAINYASYYLDVNQYKADVELTSRYVRLHTTYLDYTDKYLQTHNAKYIDTINTIKNNLIILCEQITGANSYILGSQSVASGDVIFDTNFNLQ